MQESEQNPPPAPPAPAPQDMYWGITYLHQYMQDLRQDLRALGERFDAQTIHFNKRFESIDARFESVIQRQDSHFRWLMGTMITLFVSLSGVILAAVKL